MESVFGNVAMLLLLGLIGWLLAMRGLVTHEHGVVLSRLLVWLFLPAKVFGSFSAHFTPAYLAENYMLILLSIAVLAVLAVIVYALVPRLVRDRDEQNVSKYSLLIANYAYMGYALVESLYGELVLLDMMMFALPMSMYVYTEGYRMLTSTSAVSLRKLVNPVCVAIVLGCAIGLLGIPLPDVITRTASCASACAAPVSMLLTGITVSEFRLRELIRHRGAWVISVVKLILLPLAICVVLSRFCAKETVVIAMFIYGMPCGLNPIIFGKLAGRDCRSGTAAVMISTLLSLLTIPFCLYMVDFFCSF